MQYSLKTITLHFAEYDLRIIAYTDIREIIYQAKSEARELNAILNVQSLFRDAEVHLAQARAVVAETPGSF